MLLRSFTKRSFHVPAMVAAAFLFVLLLASMIVTASPLIAESASQGSGDLKAAFLYNIIKFIRWSESALPEGEIPIGVLGDRACQEALTRELDGREIRERRVRVHAYDPEHNENPAIVFMCGEGDAESEAALKKLSARKVLTIGEQPDFLERGGAISIFTKGDRVRFDVNRRATEEAQVKVSATVLSLADRIIN